MLQKIKFGSFIPLLHHRRHFYQITIAFITFIFIGANDAAFGILIPSLSLHYHIDKVIIGQFFFSTTLGFLVTTFISSYLARKLKIYGFLVFGSICISIASLFVSLQPPFIFLPFLFFLSGIGFSVLNAGLNSFIAHLSVEAGLLNYLHAFYSIGTLVGPLICAAILFLTKNWNVIYILWIFVSILLAVSFMSLFKYPDDQSNIRAARTISDVTLKSCLRFSLVWFVSFLLCFYSGIETSIGRWSYSYLTNIYRGDPLIMSWIVSGFGLGLAMGRLLMANIAHFLKKKHIIQLSLLGTFVGLFFIWSSSNIVVLAIGFCWIGLSLGPIFPTVISYISECLPEKFLLSSIGFIASIANIGAGLFPWIAGASMQSLGSSSLVACIFILTIVAQTLWCVIVVLNKNNADKISN